MEMNGAAAKDLPRARRTSRPKVKTGCNNCKTRRVKCDETRPQCIKCVRSGRRCEGFPAQKRSGELILPIAPRPLAGGGPSSSSPSSTASSSCFAPRLISTSTSASAAPRSLIRKTPHKTRKPPQRKPHLTPPATPVQGQIILSPREGQALPSPVQGQGQLSPARVQLIPSPTAYRPGGFALDAQEGQYFSVFRTHTAHTLSGFFDSEFWTRSVLQESHSQASIRHAVVALGALYKTLDKAIESPPGSPDNVGNGGNNDSVTKHYNFALQQYGKALARLRESLDNAETRSQRTVLISIVLFTCFQSFTGDHKAAISQIQYGLRVLEERCQETRNEFSPAPQTNKKTDTVEDELVQMFTSLAIQAKSYDMAFHFPEPYVIRLSPQTQRPQEPTSPSSPASTPSSSSLSSSIPEAFENSKEAKKHLDSICEGIMRFNELLSTFHPGPNNILPKFLQYSALGFKTQFEQWSRAFQPLLDGRRRLGVGNTERAGVSVLKMMQTMSVILFKMGYSVDEMDFDAFATEFKLIVELAGEVVVDEELSLAAKKCGERGRCRHDLNSKSNLPRGLNVGLMMGMSMGGANTNPSTNSNSKWEAGIQDVYSHIKASFSLDLGIVPPLFVVATKCRDRKVRRDAIRLLMSSPRREGMWDSVLCGRVGAWIMAVEEEGMSEYTGDRGGIGGNSGGEEVPGRDKRVMVKEILFDMQKREALLRCGTRGKSEGEQDERARSKEIWW